jgi:hypothetical protein
MDLQQLCELGQQQLMQMQYLRAVKTLVQAEQLAMTQHDFDSLARLYMPLQEARRQRRQRCGEGIVKLDLIAKGPEDYLDPEKIVEAYPHGQFLVAGWQSIEPALKVRRLQAEREQYAETFLAAVHPATNGLKIMIVALEEMKTPSIELVESDLPRGARKGNTKTFAHTMSLWERLHRPFLTAADATVDLLRKIEAYRQTIRVDDACELAHQNLSFAAAQLARSRIK